MTPSAAVSMERFEDVERDVTQLKSTVYTGNGKDGLVTRMAIVEKTISAMTKLGWIILAAAFTSTGTLLVHLLMSHGK